MRKLQFVFLLFLTIGFLRCSKPEEKKATDVIRLNQVGFYPEGKKLAIVLGEGESKFFISDSSGSEELFTGNLSAAWQSGYSDKKNRIADFSEFKEEGTFVVVVPGVGVSHPFEIRRGIFEPLAKASVKAFYFQRFSTALPEKFAGKWNRPFSHADDSVIIHGSAASKKRPSGTVIRSPRGWIDAGDYNKYIVNSGITTGTLLAAYEDFPDYYKQLSLDIPESGNEIPDLLDEVLWNVRWMLTMQDPNDGGVYHKCTNANFDGMVMPDKATTPRYAVQKGTAATLDFAAVTAQASRIYSQFETQLPGLSDSLKNASILAWQWAVKNPKVAYDQDKINSDFDPDITTGGYGDNNFSDEVIWAAFELAITTGTDYLKEVNVIPNESTPVPSWNDVKLLGYYSFIRHEKALEKLSFNGSKIKALIIKLADDLAGRAEKTAFATVMGGDKNDFVWGSNAVAANQGIALVNAFKISGDIKYLRYAQDNLDYLMGRNATGYCFVTGFGSRSPMHIHHRPSEADGIEEPVPGLLAGGPNPGMQDKCKYASSIADEAYTDDVCSYASNEVAINWNAPLAYLAGALEAVNGAR